MSQLWPELLRITLCPDQISIERGRPAISLKGIEHRYSPAEVIPLDPGHEPSLWDAPLAVLAIALDGLPDRHHDASVILSNHFVNYPLANSDAALPGVPTGGVVDPALEEALRRLLAAHDCRLASILPRMVAIATSHPDELHGEPGWLVLVEEGLACLGLIDDGEFVRLRNLCMWPASSVELLGVLDREALAAGLEKQPRTLLLWTRDASDEVTLPANCGWNISRLGEHRAPATLPQPVPARSLQAPASARA